LYSAQNPRFLNSVQDPGAVTAALPAVSLPWGFQWHGGHLHEFVVGRVHYGIPDDDWPNPEPFVDERRVRLNTFVEAGARRFTFLYDFGDGWAHTIKIEDFVSRARMHARPRTSGEHLPTLIL
jgi:hypothetical protein